MNTKQYYLIISSASFIAALLFFAIYNQLIIFRAPWNVQGTTMMAGIQKKQITMYYYHGDKWKTEKQELLWSDSVEKNILQILNAWFTLLDEEHLTPKKTMVQSALISNADCVYLSFDHNIFAKEETIFRKWMLIEGLLKTLALNGIVIAHVQFLVQHQQLHDAHLDFSQAWPLCGFMN